MSTPAQVLANQKNAAHSTGPRTPEGKAASSRNALKYGLTSAHIVLPGDNASDFEALHADLAAQFQPATGVESMLVDDIAAAEWRMRRVESVQNSWLAAQLETDHSPAAAATLMLSDEFRRFRRYAASYRRERESAWRRLAAIQNERIAREHEEAEAHRVAETLERERARRLQIKADWEARNPGKEYVEPRYATFRNEEAALKAALAFRG